MAGVFGGGRCYVVTRCFLLSSRSRPPSFSSSFSSSSTGRKCRRLLGVLEAHSVLRVRLVAASFPFGVGLLTTTTTIMILLPLPPSSVTRARPSRVSR